MSDFEINKLICMHLPVMIEDEQDDTDSSVMVNDIVAMYPLDPVNDWCVMGEFIVKCGMAIYPEAFTSNWIARAISLSLERKVNVVHKNPLRAVAIAYLEMQEQKESCNDNTWEQG